MSSIQEQNNLADRLRAAAKEQKQRGNAALSALLYEAADQITVKI